MKKYIVVLAALLMLSACDQTNKAVDQVQEFSNKTIDAIQDKMSSVDWEQFGLEQFNNASELATSLFDSAKEMANANLEDSETLNEMESHITNSYSCLVDASSESTAEKVMDSILQSISNAEAKSLIEKSIEKAKEAKDCVM